MRDIRQCQTEFELLEIWVWEPAGLADGASSCEHVVVSGQGRKMPAATCRPRSGRGLESARHRHGASLPDRIVSRDSGSRLCG